MSNDFDDDPTGWGGTSTSTIQNELVALLGMLRRRVRVIVLGAIAGVLIAGIYAFTATPLFKGTAQVSVDPKRQSILELPDERRRIEPVFDPARVDSQVEIVRSDWLARAVMKQLDLLNDEEFNGEGPPSLLQSLRSMVIGLFKNSEPTSEESKETATIQAILGSLKVSRVENTFVMTIDFLSENPEKAARIANAFGEIYIQDQLDINADTSKRAAGWLKERLAVLSAQAVKADTDVIEFKRANNIVTADGKSIEDQALTDLNSKLTEATAAKNQTKARLDQITTAQRSDVANLSVSDALRSEVINKLRQQYLENATRIAYLSSRYGNDHGAVVRLRTNNQSIEASVKEELRRIAESYRSEYDVAGRHEEALRASLDQQFQRTVNVGQVQVRLAELEATARAARQAFDAAMQRYVQAMQKQSYPVSDARLLSAATPPIKKHLPKRGLLLAVGAVGGALLGFGAAIGAELMDRRLKTKRDTERVTGVECLGFLPLMRTRRAGLPFNYVVKAPFSIGAEVIRGIRIAADHANDGHGARVIGIISALPGEGKSLIASNLAHLIAHGGSPVLLVDGDLRNPSLSRILAPGSNTGLPDVLLGDVPLDSATCNLSQPPLDFLPACTTLKLQHTDAIIASTAMQWLLEECRAQYAYIVIDLPPFVPVVDVKAMTHLIDAFALIIEWGVTPRDVIGDALATTPMMWDKIIGTVLNKAPMKQLKRYGEHVSHYYNRNYFKH